MPAGYSKNPLFKKLGIKENDQLLLVNPPDYYNDLIGEIKEKITFKDMDSTHLNFIHFFTNSVAELEETLPKLKIQIKKDGIIWVSWYKKSSGKITELTDSTIRNTALAIGLVDTKVCAIDEKWSGLKLVFRLKDR